jgi:hypothetical protein
VPHGTVAQGTAREVYHDPQAYRISESDVWLSLRANLYLLMKYPHSSANLRHLLYGRRPFNNLASILQSLI